MSHKTPYNYAILRYNTPELERENTLLPGKYLKSKKYALILKSVLKDGTEAISCIEYSSDLEVLIQQMKDFCSWYNAVFGLKKDIQGNISEY